MLNNPRKSNNNPKKPQLNIEAYKYAIAQIESGGGKNMWNKTSSATGRYQFLYNLIKKDPVMAGVSRREFMNRPDLQEAIMDKALAGKLSGYVYGSDYADKIRREYNSDLDINSATALVHFLGPGNARKYLKDPVNFKVPGKVNATGQQYIDRFQKHFKKYIADHQPAQPAQPVYNRNVVPNEMDQAYSRVDNTYVSTQRPYSNPSPKVNFNDNFDSEKFSSDLYEDIGRYKKRNEELNQFNDGGKLGYMVKKGDTLSKIARSNNTSLIDLLKHNPNYANDPNKIFEGDYINLDYMNKAVKPQAIESSVRDEYASREPETFEEAFKMNREMYGPNKIFEFKGRKYGTNLAGEEFNPSESELSKFNMNSDKVKNRIKNQNKQVKSPVTSKNTLKLEPEYKSWDEVKERKLEINKMSQLDRIRNYHKKSKKKGKYIIIDKKKGLAHVYDNSSDEPLYSSPIDLGKNESDAQTVTQIDREAADKNKDGVISKEEASTAKADFTKGNKSTGAGKFKVSNISKTGYGGKPILNLTNESGIEVATSIHKGFVDDGVSRVSNGCIRCNPRTLDYLASNFTGGEDVYVLPEDEGNEFVYENGKLNFRANSGKNYNEYVDSKGVKRKGHGINRTEHTLQYNPIKIDIDKDSFANDKFTYFDFNDEEEYNNVVVPYVSALQDNKQKIMKAAKINGDAYNDIAKVAFGILGVESNFGDTHSAHGNLLRAGMKYFDKDSSSPDYKSKEGYREFAGRKSENTSTGLTQVRWSQTDSEDRKVLKKFGITSGKDFLNPKKAAIGTMVLLANRYKFQLDNKEKLDIMSNLPKTWNNRGNYSDRVKSSSKYISLSEMNNSGDDSNVFRHGGYMDGVSGADEMVTVFEGGGSHEENPLGGIPQGIGANGKPNLVEEGETKWNDYIFSNAYTLDGMYLDGENGSENIFRNGGSLIDPKIDPPTGRKSQSRREDDPSYDPYEDSNGEKDKKKNGGGYGPKSSETDKYPLKFEKKNPYRRYGSNRVIEVEDKRDQYLRPTPMVVTGDNGEDSVDFSQLAKDPQAQAFLDRYDNPWAREKMKEQTGLTDYDIDNMIIRGLETGKEVGGNVSYSKASYDDDKRLIHMGEDHAHDENVETHERVHASGFDSAQGQRLLDLLGNPFQQEGRSFLKRTNPEVLRYLNRPYETYGNFVEFREKLGLKPGEKIDLKELHKRVKDTGASMENFYRAFGDEKIIEALNTIAYEENKNIDNNFNEYKLA